MVSEKVGLFGDSYGCLSIQGKIAWFENPVILEKYSFENYSKKGSDITYSYKKFLENHKKFKKNIFIVTESTRHTFSVGPHTMYVSNIDSIDAISENIKDFKIQKILNSLKDHYLYTMSLELYDYGLSGMVEEIKNQRPDTIIVYGFYNNSIKKITGGDFYLSQISSLELEKFKIDFEKMKKTKMGDGRSSHLTDENNQIFANYIRKKLDGESCDLQLSDFIIPDYNDRLKYFSDSIS
jgi:hypothetical protein